MIGHTALHGGDKIRSAAMHRHDDIWVHPFQFIDRILNIIVRSGA